MSIPLIARVQRLSFKKLTKQVAHDFRSDNFGRQDHIDQELSQENKIIVGDPDKIISFFKEIIDNSRDKKKEGLRLTRCQSNKDIEDDTNLATSMFFGISKANFDLIEDKESFIKEFTSAIHNQLKIDYGENAIKSLILHCDEPNAPPHLQAIICPETTITSKNRYGRTERKAVSHAALFVDKITDMKAWRKSGQTAEKSKLGAFQTRYAKAVSHLGIVRGTRNAWRRRHEPCRPPAPIDAPQLEADLPSFKDRLFLTKKIKEEFETSSKILNRISIEDAKIIAAKAYNQGFNEAITEIKELFYTYKEFASKSRQLEILTRTVERRYDNLKKEFEAQTKMIKKFYTQQEQTEIRNYPLDVVCERLGLIDKNATQIKSKHNFISCDNTIAIDFKKDEPLWSDFKNGITGKYGAIDLIMYVNNCTFQEAMNWAVNNLNVSLLLRDENTKSIIQNKQNIRTALSVPPKEFVKPIASVNREDVERCKIYLLQRGLNLELINRFFTDGSIYPTTLHGYTNLVFCTSNNAAEVHGISGLHPFKGMAQSSMRRQGPAFLLAGKEKLMLFESALDLLAWHQLHQQDNRILASVSGVGTNIETTWVQKMCTDFSISNVVCGYDNDEAGESAFQDLKTSLNANGISVLREKSPLGKDWADAIEDKNLRFFTARSSESAEHFLSRYDKEQMEAAEERPASPSPR